VGTIETLVVGDEFFFLEMNTRIQVEHTISEMTSGLDLIAEQLRVAAGEPLGYGQDDIAFRGHAIEARVNAEDPTENFRPAPGKITAYHEPGGPGVRVDAAATLGTDITPDYDSMIAKLVVWAPTRERARARLRRAIDEYRIGGVPTTLGFLRALNDHEPVARGDYGTATLEAFAATWSALPGAGETAASQQVATPAPTDVVRVEVNDKLFTVRLIDPIGARGHSRTSRPSAPKPGSGRSRNGRVAGGNDVVAPMHGVVVEVSVAPGDEVHEGQVVAVIEAMKMMNEIRAHRGGSVAAVVAAVGSTVEANTPLLTLA
jgi:acetyl-CoA/propionyl-CoA carboxylase biotin carboxyl carrier protein